MPQKTSDKAPLKLPTTVLLVIGRLSLAYSFAVDAMTVVRILYGVIPIDLLLYVLPIPGVLLAIVGEVDKEARPAVAGPAVRPRRRVPFDQAAIAALVALNFLALFWLGLAPPKIVEDHGRYHVKRHPERLRNEAEYIASRHDDWVGFMNGLAAILLLNGARIERAHRRRSRGDLVAHTGG